MKMSLAIASAFALVLIFAPSDKALDRCMELHSFDTCHFALNR